MEKAFSSAVVRKSLSKCASNNFCFDDIACTFTNFLSFHKWHAREGICYWQFTIGLHFGRLKQSCDSRFQRAFTACVFVFKVLTLAWANQGNYFENANAYRKRTLKMTAATQLHVGLHRNSWTNISTIQPVYNDQTWDLKIVTVVDRWSLSRGHLSSKSPIWDLKMVVVSRYSKVVDI